jgi:hypothetical protein
VERGGEVDDVGQRSAGVEEGAVEGLACAGGSARRVDVARVLEVVADDERGAVLAAAVAAEALAGTEGFDGDAVAEHDGAGAPHGAAGSGLGIMAGEERVVEELGFEFFQ